MRLSSPTPVDTTKAKVYEGAREPFVVTVNGEPLDPRIDLVNHSPDGFAWGYGGSGPAQLAFAVLCDLYGKDVAFGFYQDFKWKVISQLPFEKWRLTEADVFAALLEIQRERSVETGDAP